MNGLTIDQEFTDEARASGERYVWECAVGGRSPVIVPSGGASVVAYQNWRGEVATREIKPICLWFGQTQWHPEDQWFLTAWDVEKQVERDFALTGFVNPKEMANALV